MRRIRWTAVFGGVVVGLLSGVALGDESAEKGKVEQSTNEKEEALLTLVVTPPEGWFSKRFKNPSDGTEMLSISKTDEEAGEDGFGIFRHPGFKTAPYTPEGIIAVNIQASFIPGGLPFRRKDIKVGVDKLDAKWLGYTRNGKTTDLVFVKHEHNVYRLSGTYPKDDEAMRDLFWEMVKGAQFVSESSK